MVDRPRRASAHPHAPGDAWFPGVRAAGAVECVDLALDGDRVAAGGFWVVVGEFEGRIRAWRMVDVERTDPPVAPPTPDAGRARSAQLDPPGAMGEGSAWRGPVRSSWTTSLDETGYRAGVAAVRSSVRDGEVYQVNLCRVLSAPLPTAGGRAPDAHALAARLEAGNPAPFSGGIQVPSGAGVPPVWVVSASPELYLRVHEGVVTSGPIKGTATTVAGLSGKDRAENIMIADMVRNDLQRVCAPGTVEVTDLLAVERHPGLVHLVTTVQGRLLDGGDWPGLLRATYPPASVSGAPKHSALQVIRRLEPVPRGPYCGTIGWVDADAGSAQLAVGIRTFWWTERDGGRLRFGTGAGITWDSDPAQEWAETELKARRLVALASSDGAG